MRQAKCLAGHFYDADRFQSCPVCAKMDGQSIGVGGFSAPVGGQAAASGAQDVTVPLSRAGEGTVTQPLGYAAVKEDAFDKTISINSTQTGIEPVVGWLVSVNPDSSSKGTDYRLTAGRNFIGRDKKMSVALTGDRAVSRERHAIVVFDPNSTKFYAQPGESSELFYLNGKVVLETVELSAYDVLRIGSTDLLFIPCCGDRFNWNK